MANLSYSFEHYNVQLRNLDSLSEQQSQIQDLEACIGTDLDYSRFYRSLYDSSSDDSSQGSSSSNDGVSSKPVAEANISELSFPVAVETGNIVAAEVANDQPPPAPDEQSVVNGGSGIPAENDIHSIVHGLCCIGDGLYHLRLGKQLANSGNIEAIKHWKIAGLQGCYEAYFNIGICYENGRAVETNYDKALKYYLKAAEHDHPKALFNYAALSIKKGSHSERNLTYLRKASDLGLKEAHLLLGELHMDGGTSQQMSEAVELFKKASEQKVLEADYYLGICYEYGKGVPKDEAKASDYYYNAAHEGHADAQHNLAVFYEHGSGGLPKSTDKAIEWYEISSHGGNPSALMEAERLRKTKGGHDTWRNDMFKINNGGDLPETTTCGSVVDVGLFDNE